jgi:hypothetical protein
MVEALAGTLQRWMEKDWQLQILLAAGLKLEGGLLETEQHQAVHGESILESEQKDDSCTMHRSKFCACNEGQRTRRNQEMTCKAVRDQNCEVHISLKTSSKRMCTRAAQT